MKEDGSFTIELTLLMPCILGVIFLIIYLGFYVHDIAVIERSCHSAVIQARNSLSAPEDLMKNFEDITNGRLIGRWMITTDVYYEENKSVFTVEGSMRIFGAVGNIYKGILSYSTRDASSKEYCEDIVRDMAYEAQLNNH